ncbi:MerR family transcriptional regulator [Lysinibacillus xylanilyticus]|uniref:MerR family transcriptional regulator n=1 Tax=Lysinibacillus xylanilyticus TaxID=582475 RepID=A0A2M9PYI7_9BACI|nr:MerR family transcriptional regulator [Lysinibacillus xylanilyticus]PJO40881.1 MerR family transcriptional regulator [Lysinibacillus xylanilyticus]
MYTIGEIAQILGVSTHTLRYYEKESIILPDRNENGERRYTDYHLKWLIFVFKLKETQMPITQIKEYTSLFKKGEQTTEARLKLLEDHKSSIEVQLETLQETYRMLDKKISTYRELIRNKE